MKASVRRAEMKAASFAASVLVVIMFARVATADTL
jgi:hypothetical protein